MADSVIVGAGSAGCVLANRLSADPAIEVVLLEAGGRDSSPFIHMPAGYPQLMISGAVDWGYPPLPPGHCSDPSFPWPPRKRPGASSSITAMGSLRRPA